MHPVPGWAGRPVSSCSHLVVRCLLYSTGTVRRGSTSPPITELGIIFRQDLLVLADFVPFKSPAGSRPSQFNTLAEIMITLRQQSTPSNTHSAWLILYIS